MCLTLIDDKKYQAEKDIVVYKQLRKIKTLDSSVKSGDKFIGKIQGNCDYLIECKGEIYIERDNIYFCTNNPNLNGQEPAYKLHNYDYYWIMDTNVMEVIINGKDCFTFGYETPYQNFKVKIGETYSSGLIKVEDEVHIGLHSFADLKDIEYSIYTTRIVAKCIIPKDSFYYKGKFGGVLSYASDKLTYVEIIE